MILFLVYLIVVVMMVISLRIAVLHLCNNVARNADEAQVLEEDPIRGRRTRHIMPSPLTQQSLCPLLLIHH